MEYVICDGIGWIVVADGVGGGSLPRGWLSWVFEVKEERQEVSKLKQGGGGCCCCLGVALMIE